MSNKILWCAVGLLSAVCAAQAYHIQSQGNAAKARPPIEDLLQEQERWLLEARKSMRGGAPIPFRRFDELFNDDFFGRRFDPFSEIEEFQKRMNPLLPDDQRSIFGRSWKRWLHDRMDLAGIRSEVKTTDKEVIVSFNIPGLKGESLRVDVNNDRIRLSYDVRNIEEKKSARGIYRGESSRHFEKVIPVPKDADPNANRIAYEGDAVRIIFVKRRT